MSDDNGLGDPDGWARLRFAIIGPLLADPAPANALGARLKALAAKSWRHPVTGLPVRFSFGTLERWYYLARDAQDPVAALRPRRRCDAGEPRALSPRLMEAVQAQYRDYPGWTVQLHYDNLAALCACDQTLRQPDLREFTLSRPPSAWRPARCAAMKPSMSMPCGIWTFIMARARC